MKHRRRKSVMLKRLSLGLFASVVVALLLKSVSMPSVAPLKAQKLEWLTMPMFALQKDPDPLAEGTMRQFLQAWGPKGGTAAQGVWIQSGLSILANYQGNVPLPAASLTKIATTLASLEKWGPDYQFETLVSATGPVKDGVLQGDLVISGGGDPFLCGKKRSLLVIVSIKWVSAVSLAIWWWRMLFI